MQKWHSSRSIVMFCHFSVIFRKIFDIFHIFEKIAPKWQKHDQKNDKKWQTKTEMTKKWQAKLKCQKKMTPKKDKKIQNKFEPFPGYGSEFLLRLPPDGMGCGIGCSTIFCWICITLIGATRCGARKIRGAWAMLFGAKISTPANCCVPVLRTDRTRRLSQNNKCSKPPTSIKHVV